LANSETGELKQMTFSGRDTGPKFAPDGKKFLFISKREIPKEERGNSLYVMPLGGGEAKLLLKKSEGIESPSWSCDGKKILFISAVGEISDDVKVIKRLGFWFNGKGFTYGLRWHVFCFDLEKNECRQLTAGEFDVKRAYFAHSNEKILYLASTDDLRPYIADAFVLDLRNGESIRLTGGNMEIESAAWAPDDRKALLLGHNRKRGFASHDHLWLVDVYGGGMEQLESLDKGKLNNLNSDVRMGGVDSEPKWVGDYVYFTVADGDSAHLYRLNLSDRKMEVIVDGNRSVEAFSVTDRKIVFSSMDSLHPTDLYVYDGEIRRLTWFNSKIDGDLAVVKPEKFTFTASDGMPVEGWTMIKPNAEGKIPAILYVHGGPKTAFGCAYIHEFQVYANRGYAVIYINPRGSDGYEERFADIRSRYGERDYKDLMEGLDFVLEKYPLIDSHRLAIAGGSYGGFMTNWVIGHTDRFKAAVTDRCISNWMSFWCTSDIGPWFTKDQIGFDPWDNEGALLASSPLRYVKDIKTPLLIIHSLEDYRCWLVEALQLFTALKYYGKEAELIIFPKENHELSRSGKPKHRVIRLQSYLRWFDRHLKEEVPTTS